jgi:hypothetical protein
MIMASWGFTVAVMGLNKVIVNGKPVYWLPAGTAVHVAVDRWLAGRVPEGWVRSGESQGDTLTQPVSTGDNRSLRSSITRLLAA